MSMTFREKYTEIWLLLHLFLVAWGVFVFMSLFMKPFLISEFFVLVLLSLSCIPYGVTRIYQLVTVKE